MAVPAEERSMGMRPGVLLPRLAIAGFLVVLATATITFAAETAQTPAPNTPVAAAAPTTMLVPDVRRQAYVFVKSTLEESGFAWRVTGSVAGYSANLVASQSPAPGTMVVDTGAPTISPQSDPGPLLARRGARERIAVSRHRDQASRHVHEAEEAGCAEEEGRACEEDCAEEEACPRSQGEARRQAPTRVRRSRRQARAAERDPAARQGARSRCLADDSSNAD